jgi:chromosome segregation ATPase
MYLKALQISGFKSFAKNTTLEFKRGITAIVGPNGSGKSNVADSIRWVMGEQSIKTLRGKKSEDVIFSGSDKKTRLGLAEVALELDNSEKTVPIDYSDLLITRKIYRSGESEYLINNAKSKLSDINLLLTKANFGHRTYSVIGQGMIDNFLIATPQERKEFFEEATGVKQYQIKKNQSLNKLENVWQNLTTVKIKTTEMEPQLRLLTRQVNKLQKRKEVENELTELRLNYYSAFWQEIEIKYNAEKNEIEKLEEQKSVVYNKHKEYEQKLENLTKENASSKEIDALRVTEQDLIEQKMELKEKILTERINQTKKIETSVKNIKNISQTELENINSLINEVNLLHKKLIDELDRESNIDLLKKQIFNINKKIDYILSELKPFLTVSEPAKINTTKPEQAIKLEESLDQINIKMSDLQQKIKDIQLEDSTNRQSLWQVQKDLQAHQLDLTNINSRINETRVSLARTETKRFDLLQEINYELKGTSNLITDPLSPLTDEQKITNLNKINKLKNQLEIIGGIDPEIEAEYETTKTRYDFLISQTEDLTKTTESLKKLVDELNSIIKRQINKSFTDINSYFQKYFKILFEGGKAELELVKDKEKKQDSNEPEDNNGLAVNFFQEKSKAAGFTGIDVSATPPGKRLKSINALSGGERALTSIALICAIISANPSPFVVLDEVDAALDEANSIRFAEILDRLSNRTQFVVITHNRATMEKANLLYGVTMGDDSVSKLLSIKLEEAKKYDR